MMRRSVLVALLVGTVMATAVAAEDLKVIKTQRAKDVAVSLLSESGRWTPGPNAFVVELTKDGKPFDAGKVTLSTSMAMPGMAPMVAGASLRPDGLGRYRGTISFPDGGERQVTVAWDGPAGKGSTRFPVPVR
jgi:YtkA-like